MRFGRTNGRGEHLAAELSFRCRNSLFYSSPSRRGAFLRLGRGASAPQTPGMSVGGWGGGRETQGDEKPSPRDYFPRSFTISKKYPGLGENISRGAAGWGAGVRPGSRGAELVSRRQRPRRRRRRSPAGGGGGGPRRPEAHRPRLREGRVPSRVSLRGFLHSGFQIVKSSLSNGGSRGSGSMDKPTASAEQSWEGPAGGPRGAGERGQGGRQAGPCAPRDGGRRGGAGGLPFPARPGAPRSVLIAAAPSRMR